MKLRLSTKLFVSSGVLLVFLSVSSFGILYRAQNQLVEKQMDALLDNQILALTALVGARPNGAFDFEISPAFLDQYKRSKPSEFFKFAQVPNGTILKESSGAPELQCENFKDEAKEILASPHQRYLVKARVFKPEVENELKRLPPFEPASICLLVGVDQAPYRTLVKSTVMSTIPILVLIVLIIIMLMLAMVRALTSDLSRLTVALEVADFGATHEFPSLPTPKTVEVKSVVDKLSALHEQAAAVYRDMWLFLGRAAHQLKTPVAAMQATLQVLLRKERTQEELISGLKDVESAAVLLSGLTKKLISSSRVAYDEDLMNSDLCLEEFLANEVELFRILAQNHGVEIKLKTDSKSKLVTSEFLLKELFGNLIENAILYSPYNKGSQVLVETKVENRSVVVLICDQGGGFPESVKESLFKPFVRGDERQAPGSGLGLSIAQKAAHVLGGNIRLKKSDISGSQLEVTLPL